MAVKRMLRAIQGAVAACALMSVSALAQTDGSAITAAPVLAGDTLVVQTHDGDLYGFRPR